MMLTIFKCINCSSILKSILDFGIYLSKTPLIDQSKQFMSELLDNELAQNYLSLHFGKLLLQWESLWDIGGSIVQWLAYLLPDPAAPSTIPTIPPNISVENILDVAEVNQWH